MVGAGPGGLSAAFFLARSGFDTTVFEREESAGGVVRHVIPGFRLPVEAIENDVDFIKAHGVDFHYGVKGDEITIEALRSKGYSHIFYAIGSEVDNDIPLTGDRSRVIRSLEFLGNFRKDPAKVKLGKHVVIVGGGHTSWTVPVLQLGSVGSTRCLSCIVGLRKRCPLTMRSMPTHSLKM